jgi:hypothetical protein
MTTAACDDDNTTTTPTTPTPIVTDTFSGVLSVNGGVTHSFVTQRSGTVTVVVTGLNPANATIGVSLGTWNGTVCSVELARDQTVLGATIVGAVSGSGGVCVRTYDSGALTAPVSYVIDVSHP